MSEAARLAGEAAERARLLRGLQWLGLRRTSDRSVLHLWARQLPAGMVDGHRSAMVAPDHLLFHGLTKRLVAATFRELTVPERRHVGVSSRESLAHSHLPVISVYTSKRDAITALGISEWAATLTVFSVVLRRTLPRASRAPPAPLTTLHRVMDVVDSYTSLVFSAYYCPRVELDGLPECCRRATAVDLQARAEKFFTQVNAACLRHELAAFGTYRDVPNTHRLRELVDHVIPALFHVRHAQKLLF